MNKFSAKRVFRKLVGYKSDGIKLLLALFFIIQIFIPISMMFLKVDGETIKRVFTNETFNISVRNSVIGALISTIISVLLAYILAICVERIRIKCKRLFLVIFSLPMLIPSISHGVGLVFLFGNNGIFTNLFGININIYGLTGIVMGSVMYSFPVAFLMLSDVMKYENGEPYEAAQVLGISKIRQFTQITFPYLRKPLISVLFATFTLVVTDYGVPLLVGGKFTTLPVVMYQEVIGQLDFAKGAVYGMVLLVPAVVAFFIDLFTKDNNNSSFVTKPIVPSDRMTTKIVSYIVCVITAIFTFLPIVAFSVTAFTKSYPYDLTLSFENIRKAFDMRAGNYLFNSVVIALLVSVIGVTIAFLTAYLSARMKSPASKFLHLSVITTAAIPGIVLGLSYVLTFKTTPLYGTLAILVIVNIVHFIASPYLMMYNLLSKTNSNLEGVGYTLGINRFHMIKDVFIPMCKNTLLEMFSYFFVNCMMTISAVSFLATAVHKPLSLMITQFEAQMQMGAVAVVSLLILGVNIIMKIIVFVFGKDKYCVHSKKKRK